MGGEVRFVPAGEIMRKIPPLRGAGATSTKNALS